MSSNCYVLYDKDSRKCVVIDPGSEKSQEEINFVLAQGLTLDYIFLTHEHTDHTWGVNALLEEFHSKVVCSKQCSLNLNCESNAYFQYYYDDPNYRYVVKKVDIIIDDNAQILEWNNMYVSFLLTPGHSSGSMCFNIGSYLFTGDTLMRYKPYISKKNGSIEEYRKSVAKLILKYAEDEIMVCPGHGEETSIEQCFLL